MIDTTYLVIILVCIFSNLALFFGETLVDIFCLKIVKKQPNDSNTTLLIYTDNDENNVLQSLRSVNNSSSSFNSLLIVDNASKDNTAKIVKTFLDNNTQLNGRLIVRKSSRRYNENSEDIIQRYIKKGIVVLLKQPMILSVASMQTLKSHFQNPEVDYAYFNVLKYSNLKLINQAAQYYSIFNNRFNKINCTLSNTKNNTARMAFAFRKSPRKVKSAKVHQVFIRSVVFYSLKNKQSWISTLAMNKLTDTKPLMLRNRLFHGFGKLIALIFQISSVVTLSILIVYSVVDEPILFSIAWLIFTTSVALSILFDSGTNIKFKILESKHMLTSFLFYIVYAVYAGLQTSKFIMSRTVTISLHHGA